MKICSAEQAREWRQLGEATSRAGLPCRQSKPAHKRPAGATQRKVASHPRARPLMKDFELGEVAAVEAAIPAEQAAAAQLGVRANQEIGDDPLTRATGAAILAP